MDWMFHHWLIPLHPYQWLLCLFNHLLWCLCHFSLLNRLLQYQLHLFLLGYLFPLLLLHLHCFHLLSLLFPLIVVSTLSPLLLYVLTWILSLLTTISLPVSMTLLASCMNLTLFHISSLLGSFNLLRSVTKIGSFFGKKCFPNKSLYLSIRYFDDIIILVFPRGYPMIWKLRYWMNLWICWERVHLNYALFLHSHNHRWLKPKFILMTNQNYDCLI